jgi:hypothetical protein
MSRLFFRTQAEKERDAARREQRKLDKAIQRECKYYARLIPDTLARMGVDHWLPRADRPTLIEAKITGISGRQKVKILETRYNRHAIYLWVDTRELPYRIMLPDLYKDEVLETLSDACGRQVAWRNSPGKGSWYIIWREGAINAIPDLFRYDDAVMMTPKSAPPLYFIVGVTENNTLIRGDLAKFPHYLVAGSTFMGKSVHLNQLLCQLIERNTPDTLRFLMVDLKGGSEFGYYEALPHLQWPIITRPDDVIGVLREYQQIMVQRMELLASRKVKTVEGWNNQFPEERLPYLVMVFDELSLLLLNPDRKLAKEANLLLAAILATSRSTGGHAILCTQKPSSDVVLPYIKVNAPTRICFRVPSNSDSITVIDMGMASELPNVPGRAIYSSGPDLVEVQSPFISDERILKIVKQAIQNAGAIPATRQPDEITLQDLLDESLDNFGGKLHTDLIYTSFKGRIAREKIREMLNTVTSPVTVHGIPYRVVNRGHGKHGGKRLEPIPQEPQEKLILPRVIPHNPHSILRPASIAGRNGNQHGGDTQ